MAGSSEGDYPGAGVVRAQPARRHVRGGRPHEPLRRAALVAHGVRDALLRPARPARPRARDLRARGRVHGRGSRALPPVRPGDGSSGAATTWDSAPACSSAPRTPGSSCSPGHRRIAAMAHEAGRPYLLHSCGNLADIRSDLVEDVAIDAKHSFEDTIESVDRRARAPGATGWPCSAASTWTSSAVRTSRPSGAACATRSTPACPAGASAWARATPWRTTSPWTTSSP